MTQKISVIVADDSALMRKMISDMINMEDDMEVIDIAKNGEDLLLKLKKNVPDVVTLDMEMPRMSGLEALKEIMKLKIHIKVIMLSSLTRQGADVTIECLENGAMDFVPKPSGSISLNIEDVREDLISKIRGMKLTKKPWLNGIKTSKACIESNTPSVVGKEEKHLKFRVTNNKKISAVVIGASTGGPRALMDVITKFPEELGVPVFVVQHMPEGFTKAFAERLNKNSKINVVEATHGMEIKKDVVYIAPGGKHMEIDNDKRIILNEDPSIWGVRPAVDKLFISAVKVYNSNILGVILTGMGRDGANGIATIKKAGGITISEDESTCVIYGMPKAAFETNMVDEVIPLYDIGNRITNIVLRDVKN